MVRLDDDTAGHDERTGIVGLLDEKVQASVQVKHSRRKARSWFQLRRSWQMYVVAYRFGLVRTAGRPLKTRRSWTELDSSGSSVRKQTTDRSMDNAYERFDLIQGWVRRTVLPPLQLVGSCLQVEPCSPGALVRPAGKLGTLGMGSRHRLRHYLWVNA